MRGLWFILCSVGTKQITSLYYFVHLKLAEEKVRIQSGIYKKDLKFVDLQLHTARFQSGMLAEVYVLHQRTEHTYDLVAKIPK